MKLKTVIVATSLALASVAAQAVPLGSVSGNNYVWHLSGLTAETTLPSGVSFGNSVDGSGNYWETTWGIGRIDSIVSNIGGPNWTQGDNGVYLSYMIYGIADFAATPISVPDPTNVITPGLPAGCSVTGVPFYCTTTGYAPFLKPGVFLQNNGADKNQFGGADGKIHIDIYKTTSQLNLNSQNTSNRLGTASYTGITDVGTKWLSATFDPALFTGDLESVLQQTVDSITLPATGDGRFFASTTSEVLDGNTQWNTNGVCNTGPNPDICGMDFGANYTITTIGQALADGKLGSAPTGFQAYISDPISGNAIPEPGSLALLGLGLAGLGALRRRKAA